MNLFCYDSFPKIRLIFLCVCNISLFLLHFITIHGIVTPVCSYLMYHQILAQTQPCLLSLFYLPNTHTHTHTHTQTRSFWIWMQLKRKQIWLRLVFSQVLTVWRDWLTKNRQNLSCSQADNRIWVSTCSHTHYPYLTLLLPPATLPQQKKSRAESKHSEHCQQQFLFSYLSYRIISVFVKIKSFGFSTWTFFCHVQIWNLETQNSDKTQNFPNHWWPVFLSNNSVNLLWISVKA